jgi:hypothetical protein
MDDLTNTHSPAVPPARAAMIAEPVPASIYPITIYSFIYNDIFKIFKPNREWYHDW